MRVLVGYRPYFDFVASQFNEQWKIKPAKRKMNVWPKFGGLSVPLVKDSWNAKGFFVNGWLAADEIADVFSQVFHNVTVFDITQSGDFMSHFLCNVLENAHQACTAQRIFVESNTTMIRKNTAVKLDYDMLATAASRKGLLNLDLKRSSVATKIKNYHENVLGLKVIDFPMICPSKPHAMALLNVSITKEMKTFPERMKEKGAYQESLEEIFKKRLETRAFCNVDVEKVLKNTSWTDFLKSL